VKAGLLRAYHVLPGPLRTVGASLWGFRLRRWRYGPDAERLVAEALERESWPAERWRAWQEEKLAQVLERAAGQVPFYRRQWAERRRRGDRAAVDLLANWPILGKASVRERPEDFVADDCDRRRMYAEHTSGTTGTPLRLWWSRSTVRRWYAIFEARARRWNGVGREDRWAILGGQLVVPARRTRPPFWVWNAGLSQLYLSAYHLRPETAADYLSALADHGITYVLGYPSALGYLAGLARERGLTCPRLRVVIGNAEPFLEGQRQAIREAFACPVRDTYGMAEIVTAGSECSDGRMHLWPEVGITEILDSADDADGLGRIVATSLLNADMPLVRYDVGDRGSLPDDAAPCGCGRLLPALGKISGRCDDVVITPEGRAIGRFDPVFKADWPIREAQIEQESPSRLRVRVVPAPDFSEAHGRAIAAGVRSRVGGGMEVVVEVVPEIARTAAGKFRAVISSVAAGSSPGGRP
jgi:phenylacetate-CoA ligase